MRVYEREYEQCAVGIYSSADDARIAIGGLIAVGVPRNNISLISTLSESHDLPPAIQHGDETESSALQGAGMGGVLGLIVGSSILAVPGVGPLLVAGALASGITGAIVGGLIGAMTGWGIHEDHARYYEDQLRAGKVLVIVRGDPLTVARAVRLIGVSTPDESEVFAKMGDDSPEVDDR